jgi:hypothetical protein
MQVDKDFGVMPTEKQADETVSREGALQTDTAREAKGDGRSTCTCHPDDRPPVCQREFATTHCNLAYAQKQLSEIARKAGGGLCQLTGGGKHEFLREISFLCEEAGYDVLGDKRPRPPKAGLKSVEDATRTAPGDGSQHDTNKLEEAKEIIRKSLEVFDMMTGQFFPETADFFEGLGLKDRAERIRTLMEPREDDLQDRARSFLKENGNG